MRPATLAVAAALLLATAAQASSGGEGVVTGSSVGPLRIGASTPGQVRRFAGEPFKIWRQRTSGGFGPVNFSGELWEYRCGGTKTSPCLTLYGFQHGKLQSFLTGARGFQTRNGTRVGASLTTTIATERGHWSGFSFQCPGIDLPAPRNRTFVAQISGNTRAHAVVRGFYLSADGRDASFSACGS